MQWTVLQVRQPRRSEDWDTVFWSLSRQWLPFAPRWGWMNEVFEDRLKLWLETRRQERNTSACLHAPWTDDEKALELFGSQYS